MIQLRHTGLYVQSMDTEMMFYKEVFHMHSICEKIVQTDELIDDLLQTQKARIIVTKLLTDQGKICGFDDMLELIQVDLKSDKLLSKIPVGQIFDSGRMHLAFGVENINVVVSNLKNKGGTIKTAIHTFNNGNKCCFGQDPEDNWIEIIESRHF